MKTLISKYINTLTYTLISSLTACMGSKEKAPTELPGIWLSSFSGGANVYELLLVIDQDLNFKTSLCQFGIFPAQPWKGRLDENGQALTPYGDGNTASYSYEYSDGQLREYFVSMTKSGEAIGESELLYQRLSALPDSCQLRPTEVEITLFESEVIPGDSLNISFNYRYRNTYEENQLLLTKIRYSNQNQEMIVQTFVEESSPDADGNIVEGSAWFNANIQDLFEGEIILDFGFAPDEESGNFSGTRKNIPVNKP